MINKDLIYHFVSLIPKGKVLTYGKISNFLGIKSARLVGQLLHRNPNQKNIPCHRVVFNNGALSKNFAFGGLVSQKNRLKKEGIKFYPSSDHNQDRILLLKSFLWQPSAVLKIYFGLLRKYGFPGLWPWFSKRESHSKEEIVIGGILTQNTNWKNVQKAINNLRKNKANSLKVIYYLGKKNFTKLKQLIRPSGFYNQKGETLFNLTKYIIEKYQNLENFFKIETFKARGKLLLIKGIGKETADTILLYAGEKPIFVVDNYTRRFVKKYLNKEIISWFGRAKVIKYDNIQKFFMENLPLNIKLFQDYHALIVRWGKENYYSSIEIA